MATPAILRDNQRRAVESDARRICVNAGPGSGKTRVLVERIARGARTQSLALDRVLALTFTENSAAEMKQRLASGFLEPELRRQVELAAVSTIHGFCASLLREYAVEAGVDPRFRVLDEVEAALLRARMLDRVLDRFREAESDAFEEFSRHFRGALQPPLLGAYEEIHNQGGDLSDLANPGHSAEEIGKLVEVRLKRLEADVHRIDQRYIQPLTIIRQWVLRAQRFHEAGSLPEALAALKEAAKTINFTKLRTPALNSGLRVLRDKDNDLKEALDPRPPERPLDTLTMLGAAMVEESAAPQRRRTATLLREFEQAYQAEKTRLSSLDFDDLEHQAWRLLENEGLARAAAARFQEILVDEYQDTSRLQARILQRLGADLRMFVVGDPKQSIYAFRNAEPANFDDAWNAAGEPGQVPLLEDFRSRPEIIEAVNRHFSQVPGFGGDPGFSPLQAVESFDPKAEPSVEFWITAISQDGDAQDGKRAEARLLARAIRDRVEGGRLRITNRKAPDYQNGRAIKYGDIALLFRSTTSMGMYEAALREYGVPYYAETGRGFYDTREVADVANFLRLLDNERDELAMAAVLRSPMFGVSDDALYLLAARAREQQGARLCDVLAADGGPDLPAADRDALLRFGDIYSRLRHESQWRPLDSLVREIVHATGYVTTLYASPNGARRMANVLKLANLARGWAASSLEITSPGDLARTIDAFRCDEVRAGEAQVPAAEGAVRLMTMHAAKGLEFPVVLLPDLNRGDRSEHPEIEFLPEYGLGCSFKVKEEDAEPAKTLTQFRIRWAKQSREEREEQRVLFVAMTRARELLILSGSGTRRRDGGFGIQDRFASMGVPPQIFPAEAVAATVAPTPAPARAQIPAPLAGDPDWADQSDFIAAVTDVAEFASCPHRYYLGRYLGWRSREETELSGEREESVSSAGRGTLVHELLAGKPGDYPPAIQELAQRFRASELGQRIAAIADCRVEYPVAGKVGEHFLSGILDVKAGSLLVDYKTGRPDERGHRLQMQLYALLTGAQEAWLFYLDENGAVPVDLTPAELAEARSKVERFFVSQRTLDFPAQVEEHCLRCPFSGRQCREPQRQRAAAGKNP